MAVPPHPDPPSRMVLPDHPGAHLETGCGYVAVPFRGDNGDGWFCTKCGWAKAAAVLTARHLEAQRDWSRETFGPGPRLKGVLAHLRRELDEVEADPADVSEWVDLIILALDGALRHGHEPQAIIDAYHAKQAKNRARTWPDWRQFSQDEPIEHDRTDGTADLVPCEFCGAVTNPDRFHPVWHDDGAPMVACASCADDSPERVPS